MTSFMQSFLEGFQTVSEFAKEHIEEQVNRVEARMRVFYTRWRQRLIYTLYETVFLLASIVLLGVGLILFLTRYLPLDAILIGAGFLSLYIGLLFRILTK